MVASASGVAVSASPSGRRTRARRVAEELGRGARSGRGGVSSGLPRRSCVGVPAVVGSRFSGGRVGREMGAGRRGERTPRRGAGAGRRRAGGGRRRRGWGGRRRRGWGEMPSPPPPSPSPPPPAQLARGWYRRPRPRRHWYSAMAARAADLVFGLERLSARDDLREERLRRDGRVVPTRRAQRAWTRRWGSTPPLRASARGRARRRRDRARPRRPRDPPGGARSTFRVRDLRRDVRATPGGVQRVAAGVGRAVERTSIGTPRFRALDRRPHIAAVEGDEHIARVVTPRRVEVTTHAWAMRD